MVLDSDAPLIRRCASSILQTREQENSSLCAAILDDHGDGHAISRLDMVTEIEGRYFKKIEYPMLHLG